MFKVRCRLIGFAGNEKMFPCHFNYKVGDEFYYDGSQFTGRICPSLLPSMVPVVQGIFYLGNKYGENMIFRYRGLDTRDPGMARYDGVGFRPLQSPPEGAPEHFFKSWPRSKFEKAKGWHFICPDTRIIADFSCEPLDLSDSDYCQPFYRREISILEIIESEPGIKIEEIPNRFTDFQREKISPPITPVLMTVLLEALVDMKYVEIRDGRAYALGKEPPSRPTIG